MALNQVIKIPSDQGNFDLTGNKNNVDFTLTGGNVYDLSRSYVSITLDVTQANTLCPADYLDKGVLHMGTFIDGANGVSQATANQAPTTACLVRNAYMSSQNGGKITDIRRVDKYSFGKAMYKKSTEDFDNDLGGFFSKTDRSFYQVGASNEFNSVGNEISRQKSHDIRIPLKDIMPFCRINQYDGMKQGDTRIHLEMNFEKLRFDSSLMTNMIVPITSGGVGAGSGSYETLPDISGTNLARNMDNITLNTAVPSTYNQLISTGKYGNIADIPFYVGQYVNVSGAIGGTAIVNTTSNKITEIIRSSTSDKVVLQLDGDITNGGAAIATGAVLTSVFCNPRASTSNSIEIKNIELVSEIVNGEPAPKGNVVYETILSEEDNYPATTSLNRVYEIPPMCKNFYIMFFKDGTGLVSEEAGLKDYRFTIDNVEQSTYPIVPQDARHQDLIQRIFMNNGETIQSINEKYYYAGLSANGDVGLQGAGRHFIIGQPVAFLQRSQKLQIELNANNNMAGRHIIFYDVVKQL